MLRRLFVLLCILTIYLPIHALDRFEKPVIKVGIYQNSPKVFVDDKGIPKGIFIDLLEEIAAREEWKLEYVFSTWRENIRMLENSEIDILVDVAYSDERANKFRLNSIFVIDDWLEVFTRRDNPMNSVFDLNGKAVAVLENSIQELFLPSILKERFEIDFSIASYPDYLQMAESLQKGEADVLVASRFFYFSSQRNSDIWSTAIILRPSQVYFAFPKEGNEYLIATIDKHLVNLKNDPNSVYYKTLKYWLDQYRGRSYPIFIIWLAVIPIVLLIIVTLFVIILRKEVSARTIEVTRKKEELESVNMNLKQAITELTMTEKEMEKFRFLVENARQEIYIVFPSGKLAYINQSVSESLGYTIEELYRGGISLFDPMYGLRYFEHFQELKEKELPSFETFHFTKDGRKLTKRVKSFFLKIGEQEFVCGFAEDITELKKAEKALQASQQLFQNLANMSPVGIFRTSTDGLTTYVNPKWSELSGISYIDALGDGWIMALHPDDQEIVLNSWKDKSRSGDISEAEYRFVKPDGSIVWVLGEAVPEMDGNEIVGYIGTITDITERKKAEMLLKEKALEIETQNREYKKINVELQKAKAKAEESDRLKSAFLANMSHEIRTPMNAICGFSRLLDRENLAENKRSEYIEIINNNSFQLLNIINDIVEVSQIDSGSVGIENTTFSVNEMLTGLLEIYKKEVKGKNVIITFNKDLPDSRSFIFSDEFKIRQILSNILSNAVKFTNEGEIVFGYEVRGSELVFIVKDSGIGIPADKKEEIFERFHQVDNSLTLSRRGTGLGLSIAKAYTEMLGGSISVESLEGIGSQFFISIPFFKSQSRPFKEKPEDERDYIWDGKKILIVEDDLSNLLYLTELLSETGVEVHKVDNGIDAVKISLEDETINLVLMDLKLPKMSGVEAIAEIRKIRKTLPIVVQTACTLSNDAEKAYSMGCNDFISKPINREVFFKIINKFLG